jgi:hypothetical protein
VTVRCRLNVAACLCPTPPAAGSLFPVVLPTLLRSRTERWCSICCALTRGSLDSRFVHYCLTAGLLLRPMLGCRSARIVLLHNCVGLLGRFLFRCSLKSQCKKSDTVVRYRLSSSLSGDFRWCPFRLYLIHMSSISAASTKFVILLCLLYHASPLYLHRQLVSLALVLYGFPWLVLHCRSTPIILVV